MLGRRSAINPSTQGGVTECGNKNDFITMVLTDVVIDVRVRVWHNATLYCSEGS